MTPDSSDFQAALDKRFARAWRSGVTQLEVNAGELHREVGGYPQSNHRMATCCQVMRANMQASDEVVEEPPGGAGASLVVRYHAGG